MIKHYCFQLTQNLSFHVFKKIRLFIMNQLMDLDLEVIALEIIT